MAWIESHQEIARHPKTRRLARLLGVSLPTAIGHLHLLWWWALDFAQTGDLSQYDPVDIADAAMYEGDPKQFVDAMVAAGFIDRNADGSLALHDWMEYAGRLVERREQTRERVRRWREKHQEQEDVSPALAQRVSNALRDNEKRVSNDLTVTVPEPKQEPNQSKIIKLPPPNGGSSDSVGQGATEAAQVGDKRAEESREMGSKREQQPKAEKPSTDDVLRVYQHYCETWRDVFPRGPVLTPARREKIKTRLKRFTAEELMRACDNMHANPFYRGDNERGIPYGTLDYLVRNDEIVDRLLSTPPRASPPKGRSWQRIRESPERAAQEAEAIAKHVITI